MEDELKIEKDVVMVSRFNNKFNRAAMKMVEGDSVEFDNMLDAQRLQRALKKVNKHGAIRKQADKFRAWCVPSDGRRRR